MRRYWVTTLPGGCLTASVPTIANDLPGTPPPVADLGAPAKLIAIADAYAPTDSMDDVDGDLPVILPYERLAYGSGHAEQEAGNEVKHP
jgi:hypothetical protein